MKRVFSFLIPGILLVALIPSAHAQSDLVVYSGRAESLFMPVANLFKKKTGINIRVRSGSGGELANVIMEEGKNPRGDIFIVTDSGIMEVLRSRGLLEPNNSPALKNIPAEFRAPDGTWTGVSGRAYNIMYNTDLVTPAEAPKNWVDILDPRWKGKIAMANSANVSVVAWVTGLRQMKGDEWTLEYMRKLVGQNPAAFKGHTEVRKAVARGEFAIGLVNNYYFHLQQAEGSKNIAIVYPDQGADGIGTMVNAVAAGIIRGARNMGNARKFIDFLISDKEAQEAFAKANFEYPLLAGIPTAPGVKGLGEFKRMPVNAGLLGRELETTRNLIEKAGLR